ncbi:MAG: hypothetical protein CVT92_02700 [Bacteroidetes bacterium HGW-Bacteroidetes-1]|jgi:hypothetical protein|nr:MAG: hypothetical protein CVT92_02700 [Bacteroidetes bacterium HGW-Bacteroidetes-1]
MIHIRDNIYKHNGKFYTKEKVDYLSAACPDCDFRGNGSLGDCQFHAGLCVKHHQGYHFKLYKREIKMETKQMTEKEIIQYWVNNRKEMRVFKHAPLECRLWLKRNPTNALILHQDGYSWYNPCDVFFDGLVYTIPEDILKEKESGFIEFDIDERGMFQHQYQTPRQYKKTYWFNYLEAAPSIGIFAGWFFESKSGAGWSIFQMGETETGGFTTIANDWVKPLVPKKIRFYKGK